MANNIFKPYQILSSQLNELPISAGQFIFVTDTQLFYVDISDTQRITVSVPTASSDSIGGIKIGTGLAIDENGVLSNDEQDLAFLESPVAAVQEEDINAWNNKQDRLTSGTTIKTINNQSLLGSGNIDTKYIAGKGISIFNNTITNTVTSYNDLTDQPFIPNSIDDLLGNLDDYSWARTDVDNNFGSTQTVRGDINATNEVHANKTLSAGIFGIYQENDGSYTFGKVG